MLRLDVLRVRNLLALMLEPGQNFLPVFCHAKSGLVIPFVIFCRCSFPSNNLDVFDVFDGPNVFDGANVDRIVANTNS